MSAELLPLVLLTVSGFAATNLDNLVLLVALSAGRGRVRAASGYLLAAATLLAAAILGMLLGDALDPAWVGYLGVVPLSMGLYLGWQWARDRGTQPGVSGVKPVGVAGSYLLMISNSGDNLAIFLPLVADTRKLLLLVIVVTYITMALLWVGLARRLVAHPRVATSLERHGRWILPCIMVLVGCFVLMDTGSDRLPG